MQQTSALSTEAASCTQRGEEPGGLGGSGGRLPQEGASLTCTVVLQWSSLQSQNAHLSSVGSEPGFTALRDERHVLWRSRTATSLLKSVNAGQHREHWHHQGHWAFFHWQTAYLELYQGIHTWIWLWIEEFGISTLWKSQANVSFFDVGFTICLPDRTPCGSGVRRRKLFEQMCIPWSKITWVPQQYFRMLLPSLYEPCPSSQRGWPMKPWDSARALQVCGENPDKFILGELNFSVLHRDGVIADFRTN